MMDRISGAVMSLAVAVFGMVSPFSAQAENLARYSLDGGATWTEAENIKKALQAVQGGTTAAIIETKGDSVMTGSSAHEQYCDVILRPWEGYTEKFRFYRNVSDPMMGRWVVKSGATLTISNVVVDAGANKVLGLLVVESDATLHLDEGSEVVTSAETDAGAAIYNSGTVVFDGGVVHGWNVSGTLAPVIAKSDNARFEINAGGIEDCSCDSSSIMSGTAICGDKITVVMTGGFIRNNHSSATNDDGDYHGAISCRLTSTVEISGGAITGNTGDGEHFCAVLAGQNGLVKISGDPVIRYNTTKSGAEINVFNGLGLGYWDGRGYDSPKLQLTGDLTSGADVGLYSQWNYAEDSTFGTLSAAGFTGAEYIHNDRNATLVGKADGTNLKWMVGGVDPVDPEEPLPVYTLTIPAQTGLELGADAVTTNDVPVAGVGGVYSIVSNTEVTITFAAASGYEITDGNPVVVTVEADMTLDQFPTVKKQGGDDPVVPTGWTGAKLGADSGSVRTDGTLVYAYAKGAYQVGAVQFSAFGNVEWTNFDNDDIEFYLNGNGPSPSAPSGTEEGGYSDLLKNCWWYNGGNQTMTLKKLKKGSTYLVQIFCYRSAYNSGHVTINGETLQGESYITSGDEGFTYGGTIIGVFTAEAATKEVTIESTSQWSFNAVQVREIPPKKGVTILYL